MGNETSRTASEYFQTVQTSLESKVERLQKAMENSNNLNHDDRNSRVNGQQPEDFLQDSDGLDSSVEPVTPPTNDEIPQITEYQVQVIKSSWKILRAEIHEVGVLTFLNLFEAHPHSKKAFKKFKDMNTDELKGDDIFRHHATRVMGVIDKVVDNLETPQRFTSYLTILGQKHIMYEAKPEYLDQMGYMFLTAIKPLLESEDAWSEDVEDAWEQLFTVVIFVMRRAMIQANNEQM